MGQMDSGQAYSLSEIFSGENDKVIIPDLQRDYCWGNPIAPGSSESLVSRFLESLTQLDFNQDITMGLIYGYYDQELAPYHLQLCDGQQRLTTLFLLLGALSRRCTTGKYQPVLISQFELEEDDHEPHLLYSIRESSLYFLSDLTMHYFLHPDLPLDGLEKQPWFLHDYLLDPTIQSMRAALASIEAWLNGYQGDLDTLGCFLTQRMKFLFYDMGNRMNGEETFVVINTTGEPLTANQNLKPLLIMANPDYQRLVTLPDGTTVTHDTARDWELMETWFWQRRRRNGTDTATQGMLAFLHCVSVLESAGESQWYEGYETGSDKFPTSIKMERLWRWFSAYRRLYQVDWDRLHTPRITYPEHQHHHTQRDLYVLLPAMVYCDTHQGASDRDVERVIHLLSNMARYRNVYRYTQDKTVNVPAFRTCQMMQSLLGEDILGLLDLSTFNVAEERAKLEFIKCCAQETGKREQAEQLLAKAEGMPIYEGQVATLVQWSNGSAERLWHLYGRIKALWMDLPNPNLLRQALLAYGLKGYPAHTGTANLTLCSGTEWRTLFEREGEAVQEFLEAGEPDAVIREHRDEASPYILLIDDIEQLDFSRDHCIRLYAQGVVELMAKTRATAQYRILHRGEVFAKDLTGMEHWHGLHVWSDGQVSVLYTVSVDYNLTLDMNILEDGYQIVGWTDRQPQKPPVSPQVLEEIGFTWEGDKWTLPPIASPSEAKARLREVTAEIPRLCARTQLATQRTD